MEYNFPRFFHYKAFLLVISYKIPRWFTYWNIEKRDFYMNILLWPFIFIFPSSSYQYFLLAVDSCKVHIFWEGHKILRNFHLTFDCMYCSQKLGEDFAKFCGLLRIYELYLKIKLFSLICIFFFYLYDIYDFTMANLIS